MIEISHCRMTGQDPVKRFIGDELARPGSSEDQPKCKCHGEQQPEDGSLWAAHVRCSLPIRPTARPRTSALPPQIKASPSTIELVAREQICWPVTIRAMLNIAGMKLTAKALRKLLLRNIIPSAQPTRTSTRQLIAKLARLWISPCSLPSSLLRPRSRSVCAPRRTADVPSR